MNNCSDNDSLDLMLKPSMLAKKCTFVLHVIAVTMILNSAMPIIFSLAFIIAILISGYHAHRELLHQQIQNRHIRFTSKQGWQLKMQKDSFQSVAVLPSTWMCVWLIVLHYRIEHRVLTLAIFCDALHPDEFRRLRVYLRTRHQAKS